MPVSYNKLWKILIDEGMSKTDLIKASKITTNAMAKLGKNEDVRVEVLVKICRALNCTLDDIVDILRNLLHASGNTDADDPLKHTAINSHLAPYQFVHIICMSQRINYHTCTEKLGTDGGNGCSCNTQTQSCYQDQV